MTEEGGYIGAENKCGGRCMYLSEATFYFFIHYIHATLRLRSCFSLRSLVSCCFTFTFLFLRVCSRGRQGKGCVYGKRERFAGLRPAGTTAVEWVCLLVVYAFTWFVYERGGSFLYMDSMID